MQDYSHRKPRCRWAFNGHVSVIIEMTAQKNEQLLIHILNLKEVWGFGSLFLNAVDNYYHFSNMVSQL